MQVEVHAKAATTLSMPAAVTGFVVAAAATYLSLSATARKPGVESFKTSACWLCTMHLPSGCHPSHGRGLAW